MRAAVDILSPDLVLLGRINDYEGLSYTRALADLDSKWELKINFNKKHVDKLVRGNITGKIKEQFAKMSKEENKEVNSEE